ncbi:MAG: A/G-specific adenine glycosylase [Eubacterium sp.]|nr:A/G-specific adenine glycosylase [Eubacterium sp.]
MQRAVSEYEGKELLSLLPERLPVWYADYHRELPWRGTGNSYDVWLSEIMLQQTRVAAVIEYFLRFKEALPGIPELAACDEERLMKLWEGLGYYSRVRNLQKAARKVMEIYDGCLPETAAELRKLPGIGPYTAGAIASIAFGEAVPAVDGNVLRICARITENRKDIALPETKKGLETALLEVFREACPPVHPGILNQAMMELGATVCVPNGPPQCDVCPVADRCRSHAAGTEEALPVKSAARPRKIEQRTILLVMDGENVLIRKRPDRGLLAGLWELPARDGFLSEKQALEAAGVLLEEVSGKTGAPLFEPVFIKKLSPARHIFTHIEWEMEGWLIRVVPVISEDRISDASGSGILFADPSELRTVYALPSAFSAFLP